MIQVAIDRFPWRGIQCRVGPWRRNTFAGHDHHSFNLDVSMPPVLAVHACGGEQSVSRHEGDGRGLRCWTSGVYLADLEGQTELGFQHFLDPTVCAEIFSLIFLNNCFIDLFLRGVKFKFGLIFFTSFIIICNLEFFAWTFFEVKQPSYVVHFHAHPHPDTHTHTARTHTHTCT